jgi:predicted porin
MKMHVVVRRGEGGAHGRQARRLLSARSRTRMLAFGGALAASAALTVTPALAQSSVTLYGALDDSIEYTSNQGGHATVQAVQAGIYSSQWGLTGAEDIGGGTRVIFKLEDGFNLNNGVISNGGALFGRQAYVGLDGPYGAVRAGKQFTGSFDTLCQIVAACKFDGGLGSQIGDLNNGFGDFNINNAIKYISPSFGGFKAELMYGFGNVAGHFPAQSTVDAALSYRLGRLLLAAVYTKVNDPAVAIWGASAAPMAGHTFANPLLSPIFNGYASATHLQISGAGANLDIGTGSIGVLYTNTLLQNVVRTNTTPFSGTAVFNDVQANYAVRITPASLTGIAFNYTWAQAARYEQLMLGEQYSLSKRTLLYVTSAYQHALGTNSLGQSAVAVNSNVPASNSPNQLVVRVGIHHNF